MESHSILNLREACNQFRQIKQEFRTKNYQDAGILQNFQLFYLVECEGGAV
jgi:hypothetical protein